MLSKDRKTVFDSPDRADVEDPSVLPGFDEKALKKALLKLDCYLLPVATVIYFLNFLDRSVEKPTIQSP